MTDSIIYDLKQELNQLNLQVAIIQKTIIALGGEYNPSYCACGMVCDERLDPTYNHLDSYLKMIFPKNYTYNIINHFKKINLPEQDVSPITP